MRLGHWFAVAAVCTGLALGPAAGLAADTVPVRVRLFKGSRQGPPSYDPQLADLKPQLTRLNYARWEQSSQSDHQMSFGQTVEVSVPGEGSMSLKLTGSTKDSVTFEVKVPAQKTQSKLTISKDQRIVHQVTQEKGGTAYFTSIRAWP
jgi:hypothetical protein